MISDDAITKKMLILSFPQVIAWIFAVGLVSYIKLCISTIFRSEGGSWMFFCGSASQFGSAVGSLISFFLVNYSDIFVPSDPCK